MEPSRRRAGGWGDAPAQTQAQGHIRKSSWDEDEDNAEAVQLDNAQHQAKVDSKRDSVEEKQRPTLQKQKTEGWGSTPVKAPQRSFEAVENVDDAAADNNGSANADANASQSGPQFGRRRGGARGFADNSSSAPAAAESKSKYQEIDIVADIATIPDVEELGGEADLTRQVAEAPNVRDMRVQNLRELDRDILFQLPSATVDGIDISLLHTVLSPQEHINEADALWDFDTLFATLSSEMQTVGAEDENSGLGNSLSGSNLAAVAGPEAAKPSVGAGAGVQRVSSARGGADQKSPW